MIPVKGSRWVERNTFRRDEDGNDVPCVYVVTSYNARYGIVYVKPTWSTPVACKPWAVSLHGEEAWYSPGRWHRQPFADLFVQEVTP
jgi:hypothetical protein